MLTPADCAERACVSLSLIYSVIKQGRLKAYRIGCRGRGKYLVGEADFEAWLASCKLEDLPQEEDGDLKFLK